MTDRDLRTAFEHLKEDVMNNVQTEERLEQITKRRTRVRPAVLAFAGAAAVALIVGAAILAFRPGDTDTTIPPATGTNPPPTTTVTETSVPPTTTPDATTPPVVLPELTSGTVVIADPSLAPADPSVGEIAVETIDATTVAIGVDAVVGDGNGGLFIQIGSTIGWARPDGPAINLISGDDFVEGETVTFRLQDVAIVNGQPNVLFIVAGGVEEQRYEEVWRYDVSTGAPSRIYRTGAYEGGITRASFAGDTLVVTRHAEGFSWFEFSNIDGQPIDVNNPKPDGAEFPVYVDQGVLSPDGSTLVYLESDTPAPPEDNNWRVDLVVWDLANGIEDRRMELELGNWYADRMDFDGTGIVLGRIQWTGEAWTTGTALRVESLDADAGIVTELDVTGSASLVK